MNKVHQGFLINIAMIKLNKIFIYKIVRLLPASMLLALLSLSCENNIEVVQSLSDPVKIPDATVHNSEILYYDSAHLMAKIQAPVLLRFSIPKDPYYEFPNGIHVEFYDSLMQVNAEVTSKYAIFKENKRLWEARKDVVVVNRKGERLNTEQLFWDQNQKILYTEKFCRITSPDVNLTGDGLRAREDFTGWTLTNVRGPLKIKDE